MIVDLEGVSPCPLSVQATDLWSVSAWKIDVRLGSIASVWPIAGYFRSSPNNGHGEAGPPGPKSANNGSDHFGVLGLRVAAASCHSGKQEQTSKRSVRQHVAILPVTGAIGPV